MSKQQKGFHLGAFLGDVGIEFRKISWPHRQELVESTVVVIVSIVLLSIFVALCDKILIAALDFIIPS